MPPPAHSPQSLAGRPVNSIHWFRHGLRLHDNPALLEALRNCSDFYPIFIFDGEVAGLLTNLIVIYLQNIARHHSNMMLSL